MPAERNSPERKRELAQAFIDYEMQGKKGLSFAVQRDPAFALIALEIAENGINTPSFPDNRRDFMKAYRVIIENFPQI